MQKERIRVIAFVLVAIMALTGLFMLPFNTGNVLLNAPQNFVVGDSLKGILSIGIEQGDKVKTDAPVLIALSRDNSVLVVKTLTIGELFAFSDSSIGPVEGYYVNPESYQLEISKVFNYTFVEKGDYELIVHIYEPEISSKQTIVVNE
jgi:hypothetical protein